MKQIRPWLIVLVASLGYFVDVFDVVLFSVVRTQSLRDLGISGDGLVSEGVKLLNAQMAGMMIGGLIWGILGDKIGRVQALFGSIILYSLANFGNALVANVEWYELMRFISGFGLAGEIGGAITLVGEALSKERRGLGTGCVLIAGAVGAVVASYASVIFDWRTMYCIGGVMGVALLALRLSVSESTLFNAVKKDREVKRGSIWLIFNNRDRLTRFIALVVIGAQFMFSWSFLATFAPEIARESAGLVGIKAALPISYFAIGITFGDLASTLASQYLRRRKMVMTSFLIAQVLGVLGMIHLNFGKEWIFNAWYLPIGFFGGMWAVLVTTASEQFGTNLRTTVTCMIPNLCRGTTIVLGWCFLYLKTNLGIVDCIHVMMIGCLLLAFVGLARIRESFGISMAFVEVRNGQRWHSDNEEAPVNGAKLAEVKKVAGWS